MKKYKQLSFSDKVRWRIRALWLLLMLMLAYMVVIGELHLGDSRIMSSLANDVSRIIFFGGIIWVVYKIVRNKKLLKSPWQLKQQMNEEFDERNRFLHDKSGGIVWDVLFVCMLFITLTTSLTNMPAFYTAYAILCIAIILKAAAYFFYKNSN